MKTFYNKEKEGHKGKTLLLISVSFLLFIPPLIHRKRKKNQLYLLFFFLKILYFPSRMSIPLHLKPSPLDGGIRKVNVFPGHWS